MKYTDSFYSKTTKEYPDKRDFNIKKTSDEAFCLICRENIKLLNFREALEIFRCDEDELRNLVLSGQVHPIHNMSGVLMFCGKSIEEAFHEELPTQNLDPNAFVTNPSLEFATNPSLDNFDIHRTQPN